MPDVVLFLRKRLILIGILVVFVLYKSPHLYLPWYWDESWPYAAAIRSMCNNGIGLMPQNLHPDLSRGHPLLFHAFAASWMKIFGSSYMAMHSFSLCVAVVLLIVVHENVQRLFGNIAAIISTALIAVTEGFIVQSSAVMLEVPFALLCLLSLFSYVRGQLIATFIWVSALLLVKESGFVLWALLGITSFLGVFNGTERKKSVQMCTVLGAAAVPVALFFLMQKHVYGWYLFPLHSGTLRTHWQDYWNMFRMYVLHSVFCKNLRFWYYIVLSVLALIVAIRHNRWQYLGLLVPVLYVYQLVDEARASAILPPVYFLALLFPIWIWSSIFIGRTYFTNKVAGYFVSLSLIFILLFVTFSTFTFLIYRYLIVLVVLSLIIFSAILSSLLEKLPQWVLFPSTVAIAVIACLGFRDSKTDKGDADFGAYDGVMIHKEVADFMETNRLQNKHIACGPYLQLIHLTQPLTGFLKQNLPFTHVKWEIDDSTEYIIFDNIEPDIRYERRNEWPDYYRLVRFQQGVLWAEIYERHRSKEH